MGANAPAVCTFEARGMQEKFKGTACVRRASWENRLCTAGLDAALAALADANRLRREAMCGRVGVSSMQSGTYPLAENSCR